MCHGAGYGADGPYAGEPAYDDLIQSGLGPRRPPAAAPTAIPTPRLLPTPGRRQGLGPVHGPGDPRRAVPPAEAPARASSSRCRCWSASPASTWPRHFYGHVYDPPTGQWAYTRVANPEPQALPDQGRLHRPAALHRPAVGPVLRDRRLGRDLRARTRASPTTAPAAAAHRASSTAWSTRSPAPAPPTSGWRCSKPLQIPVVKMNRLDDLLDRSAPGGGRPVRALRASRRRALHRHPAAGEILRHARQHPPPSAPAGRAHRRGAGRDRGKRRRRMSDV